MEEQQNSPPAPQVQRPRRRKRANEYANMAPPRRSKRLNFVSLETLAHADPVADNALNDGGDISNPPQHDTVAAADETAEYDEGLGSIGTSSVNNESFDTFLTSSNPIPPGTVAAAAVVDETVENDLHRQLQYNINSVADGEASNNCGEILSVETSWNSESVDDHFTPTTYSNLTSAQNHTVAVDDETAENDGGIHTIETSSLNNESLNDHFFPSRQSTLAPPENYNIGDETEEKEKKAQIDNDVIYLLTKVKQPLSPSPVPPIVEFQNATSPPANDNENINNGTVIPLFPIQYNCPSELFFQRCCENAFPTARSVNDNENSSNETVIPLFPIQYNCPSELFFQRCCEKLNLKCDRQLYIRFLRRIEIYEILPDSIPNDSSRNGFESLSILFSGNLENAKMIQTKINGFIYDNLEKDDFLKVMSCRPSFTFKDIVFLADWFKFKFLFYANESWKSSENWNSEISDVLIFKQSGLDEGNFEVVFSLNDE
uniref:Uncharacterized protein n=1 Tax=Panagrolaimus sp. ES5 TaxID=591445 RepID=A0AC34FSE9_9BILA